MDEFSTTVKDEFSAFVSDSDVGNLQLMNIFHHDC